MIEIVFLFSFCFCGAAGLLVIASIVNNNRRINRSAALIWQLKDEGRITGPEAGKLLSTLYGDR